MWDLLSASPSPTSRANGTTVPPAAGQNHWLTLPGVLLVILCLPMVSMAQEGVTLAGRVLDNDDGSPVGLATVVVESAESGEALSGALAGEDGRFLVQGLAPGRYTVRTSFPGMYPTETDVLVSELNLSYDLGDVRLIRLVSLEEITVTADAIRAAGVDTQVFRLDEGATLSTGSLLDAMRNSPA